MDFREATDQLKRPVTDEEIADEIGVSVQSVRQARVEEGMASHRSPPEGWRDALIRIARRRRRDLKRLVDELLQGTSAE